MATADRTRNPDTLFAGDLDTLSCSGDPEAIASTDRCDQLFVVARGDRPLAPPSRHLLRGVDEVEIVRADSSWGVCRVERRVLIAIPDRRVSSHHARLTRTATGWIVEDLGSKNGTFVGGDARLTAPTPLPDGALLTIGQTFLLLREAAPASGPLDVDGATDATGGGALATMSIALGHAFEDLALVATTGASILIQGETGTGKERVAHAIHAMAARTGALVAVNCGALPPSLAASELFGHLRGAFSGAAADRVGLVASADRGTLFLDEIGDLPRDIQPTLLRVLQEREVQALGANRPLAIDLRVVSASHRDLGAAVAAGEFRADLHARIAAFTLMVPPLRERREDTGLIVAELLRRHAPDPASITLSRGALAAIFAHGWPQNIRELESALKVALALARDGAIRVEHLPAAVRSEPGRTDTSTDAPAATPAPLSERRAAELARLLERHGGNVAEVARALHRQRTLVHRWLRRYGIDPSHYRK